jgi:YHS domain-containing protein
MIRWALLLLVIYIGYRLVRRYLAKPAQRPRRREPDRVDDVMVKDPVCGSYFPQRDGVVLRDGGRELHFCSEKCRDRYQRTKTSEV